MRKLRAAPSICRDVRIASKEFSPFFYNAESAENDGGKANAKYNA